MNAEHMVDRAQAAQDRIGWTDSTDALEMAAGVLDLARVVTDLARAMLHTHPPVEKPVPVDSGPIEDVRGRVRQILQGPVCADCGVQADDDVIEEVDAVLRSGLLGGTDA